MNFTVAEYADEVNEEYILKALKFGYQGRKYVDKFSNKLVRVLLSDYRKKAKNLAWFMKDDTGRVRNYIRLDTDPVKLVKNAKSNSGFVRDIHETLLSIGAKFTAEEFINNRCTYQNQSMKISKVILNRPNTIPYNYSIWRDGKNKVIYEGNTLKKSWITPYENGVIVYKDDGHNQVQAFLKSEEVLLEVKDKLSGYSKDDIEGALQDIKASTLTISMDLVDMITCSSGDCSSCLSIDNIHAAGAIQNFRTEFALITFTSRDSDRFSKRGRSWLFLRATEKGFVRKFPFWKQQKTYGSVTSTHIDLLNEKIETEMKAFTGISKFKPYSSWSSYYVSPNAHTSVTGHSHTSAPGYMDTHHNGNLAFFIPSHLQDKMGIQESMLLPFKDMVNLHGDESNITSFHVDYNSNGYFGAMGENTYDVVCEATGTTVIDTDAVEIDGKWYRKDVLSQLMTGTKDVVLEQEVTTDVVEEDYEDVELDEDF